MFQCEEIVLLLDAHVFIYYSFHVLQGTHWIGWLTQLALENMVVEAACREVKFAAFTAKAAR